MAHAGHPVHALTRHRERLLSRRELNRATLARQHLLARGDLSPEAAVEAVGALQAQYAPAPPVALWSRVCAFSMDDYASALRERRLVTGLLMRGTLHVVSAAEYWPITAAVATIQDGSVPPEGLILPDLRADLEDRAAVGPMTQPEVTAYLRDWLTQHGHDADDPETARRGRATWRIVRGSTALLNVDKAYVSAHAVLPPPPASAVADGLTALVRHHLRAFGPAAAEDVASWIGYVAPPQLQAVLDAMASQLARFRDDAGRLLYDLEAAPRPDAEVAAPVRYLSWFDSLLLAYAPRHRGRVLPEPYRAAVIRTANLQVLATFLVDGMVAGTWEVEAGRRLATLVVRPLGRIERGSRQALLDEGERLVRFLRPEAGSHGVRFEGG